MINNSGAASLYPNTAIAEKLFNEKDLYAHLASAGLQRSKHFSWVSSATCHARVFFLAAQSLR